MPSSTVKQAKVMSAIAHGWHPSGGSVAKIPKKVAVEFHDADAGHKYGHGMHKGKKTKAALRVAKKYSGGKVRGYDDGGDVPDDQVPMAPPKRLYMDMSSTQGSPQLTSDLLKKTPIEGMEPAQPSLTEHHDTPRDTITNLLAGSDTPPLSPRRVLANKAMNVLDLTPPMMAEQAGEDLAKGDVQSAATFAMPGVKKAKDITAPLLHAAEYAMGNTSSGPYVGKVLKEQYGKDLAAKAIDLGLTPEQIDSVKTYMTPGAQKNFDKHYGKMNKGSNLAPWLDPDIQATKPDYTPKLPDWAVEAEQEHQKNLQYYNNSLPDGYNLSGVNGGQIYAVTNGNDGIYHAVGKTPAEAASNFHNFHPMGANYIEQYHKSQGVDYNKMLAEIAGYEPTQEPYSHGIDEWANQGAPQKPTVGISAQDFNQDNKIKDPHETWGNYDALHDHFAGQGFPLTNSEKKAVAYWTDPAGYKDLNGHLRGAVDSDTAVGMIPELDNAINGNPLQQDSIMWRGLHGPHAEALKGLEPGDTFYNAGYTATTVDPRRATHYGAKDGPGIILNYHLPEGFPALYTSHPDAGGWSQAEREMLLPHGAAFRIIDTERIKAPSWDYSGNVKSATPKEFIVYHVEPSENPSGATQLDKVPGKTPIYNPKSFSNVVPFKPKGEDTDIEDYYNHMEEHQAGPEWEPDEDDHHPSKFKDAPYQKYVTGKIGFEKYAEETRNHFKASDWLKYEPRDVPEGHEERLNFGNNNPTDLEKLGFNTRVPIHKGGQWGDFKAGSYPKELPDITKKYGEPAWFAATHPGIAAAYHGNFEMGGSYIARAPKFYEFNWPSFAGDEHYSSADMNFVLKQAKEMGADVVAFHNMRDVGSGKHGTHTQLAFLDTHFLRAPHAGFDPAKLHLRYPLAGLAGGGLFTYGAMGGGDKDNHFAEGGGVGDDYNTVLSPEDESQFQVWKQQNMPDDTGVDYDQRGAFKAQFQQQSNGHWEDQFKKPNHPTFSDQSQYATGDQRDRAGYWVGDQFVPPANKARGGKTMAKKEEDPKDHEFIHFAKGGLIDSDIPGRTDKIPMKVAAGSYVLPADIPSALGQNNTKAGSEVLKKMFSSAPYGLAPMKQKAAKFHFDSFPHIGNGIKTKAGGGEVDHVPIIAAGGEYVIHPDVVKAVGHGDMAAGHKVLDKFVLHTRKEHIKTLKKLKPPKV